MRILVCIFFAALLSSCNSSGKKDPNKEMDDTARMDSPPVADTPAITAVSVPASDIPASIRVKGKVQQVWKWSDTMGDNLLITSVVAPFDDKDPVSGEEGQTAELHAFHYAGKDGNYQQVWTMSDAEKACPFDITAEFIRDAISVTDLDADGLAETTVIYRIVCRSDVSPSTMKLIMHEGAAKYALRGLTWYGMGDTKFEVTEDNANLEKLAGYNKEEDFVKAFGRYESEKEFGNAPPAFIPYARKQWMKFVKESLE